MRRVPRLLPLLLPPMLACSSAAAQLIVEVDASQPQAPLQDLLGVNKPPLFDSRTPGLRYDARPLYRAFGISQVRLHDAGVGLCNIYQAATRLNVGVTPSVPVTGCTLTGSGAPPHFMWTPSSSADADLDNAANYDFTALDQIAAEVHDSGAQVYLNLAMDFNGPNDTADPVAWAKVATNIYRHLIGAFKPTPGVALDPAFVEIHNEPDGGFWRGSASTFNTLYAENTQRVRSAAAAAGRSVTAGGPGFTHSVLQTSRQAGNPANGFIANVGAGSLDFYSAHLYDKCAAASLANSAGFLRSLRALVDGQGGAGKPIHVTEWNIGLGQQCGNALYAEQRLQSYASGVLTLMQDPAQRITAAHFYAGVTIMSLFDFTSVPDAVRINPSAWAFRAHANLKGATGLATQVCAAGSACVPGYAADATPLLALGGQAADGKLIVIVTNDGSAAQDYTLRLKGLGANTIASALVRNPPQGPQDIAAAGNPAVPDAAALAALLAAGDTVQKQNLDVVSGQLQLSMHVPARSLQLLELWPGQGLPPVTNAQADCLMNWGEANHPALLPPPRPPSQALAPYYYRYYAGTDTYLGISSSDQRLYYLAGSQGGTLADLGPAMTWVIAAGCQ